MKRRTRGKGAALAGTVAALAVAGSAAAFQALPPGLQVNDDPAAGIDKTAGVNGDSPANSDVVGGALTAGKPAVPWAVLRAQETSGKDQVFARSFANGAWTTRGSGTVGGRSSASPTFSGSLNFDQTSDGEAPSIDFAGAGRTVPWSAWYEQTSGFGASGLNQIFASRFDNTGGANQGKWIFGGQGRGLAGGSVPVPSLNINTDQSAENPVVAGGSAVDPTKPGPWVTWQETDTLPAAGKDQIFVTRPIGPGSANCDGIKPLGVADGSGHVPAIGGFCWQQTGVPRVGASAADPSLNVDPTRDGVEPDIAFTGANDSVPWVVWYEKGSSTITGLHGNGAVNGNEMVFAAKGVSDGVGANGGFHWVAVGSLLQGTLDTSGTNAFGACAASATAEEQCSLNKNPSNDAENPAVAAGTMNPANATVPWVAWDETLNGVKQVFVSRAVGTGAAQHFELVNNGAPISIGANDSTRPDITFSGNTPYVSWREDIGGGIVKGFYGHFVNAANPTFVLDESDVPLTPTAQGDVREPISSSCTANPFNQDGASCQGGAIGTPFFLFTSGTNPRGIFADAYQPGTPATGAASAITESSATVAASVNPQGAAVKVSFQYGTTTSYGQSTTPQTLGVGNQDASFSGQLTGLPAGTLIHYRAIAVSDFGTVVGNDQTLTTSTPPPPPPGDGAASAGNAHVSGNTAGVKVTCAGASGATCKLSLQLTVVETLKGHKLIAVAAKARKTHKTVSVGATSVTLTAGESKTVQVSLNRTGRHLLAKLHTLPAKLAITQSLADGTTTKVSSQNLVFKVPRKHGHGH
jgi:hypothetical protein